MVEVKVGQMFEKDAVVKESMLASAVGSGKVNVLATPMMIALMEETSMQCLQQFLTDELSSVGTSINVTHSAATPRGMRVVVQSTITNVDGRSITFSVRARDQVGLIGEGTHTRFIINTENFNAKTMEKLF